jgi:hypothetical protein
LIDPDFAIFAARTIVAGNADERSAMDERVGDGWFRDFGRAWATNIEAFTMRY